MTARSLVDAIDAAIAAQQDVIRQLCRARAAAEELADNAEIDARMDDIFDNCPHCGPACVCRLKVALAKADPGHVVNGPDIIPAVRR